MSWLTMALFALAFVVLTLLTGGSGDDRPSDSRRRMRDRLSHGGFPTESWEIY
jgi:hypothetical protein